MTTYQKVELDTPVRLYVKFENRAKREGFLTPEECAAFYLSKKVSLTQRLRESCVVK